MSDNHAEEGQTSVQRRGLLVLFGIVLLVIWAQKGALLAFFSSPDDMVHLQQAVGLKPILASPFRFLSQVVYFKVMVAVFGPLPTIFHLTSLVVHLINVGLVFHLVLQLAGRLSVAAFAACLFGCFPLFFSLLASAVGMNDELALTFTLLALGFVRSPRRWATTLACAAFVVALLCKESVLAMPLLAFAVANPAKRIRRCIPMVAIAGVFAVLLLLRPPQGLEPYAMGLGANVFHNAMTYASWAVNLTRPMPDLVSSFDPTAWRVGIWVYVILGLTFVLLRSNRDLIRVGAVWWIAGLAPVMALKYQTFRHYLYPALPGIALIVAVAITAVVQGLLRAQHGENSPVRLRLAATILALCAVGYSIRADRLILERIQARVPGTRLALDPFIRRQEVAANALGSLAQSLPPNESVDVVILQPEGTGRTFGARSGKEYTNVSPRQARYDLLRESLDGGRAVKVFFPQVRSVEFVSRWTPGHAGRELFLPYIEGFLVGFGRDPSGCVRALDWMLQQGMTQQAHVFQDSAVAAFPNNPELRRNLPSVSEPAGP